MTARIIFEDEEILVLYRSGASDFSLVTFAAVGHAPDRDWFWGEPLARKLDLETIGFVAKRPNWYPVASMARIAPLVRAALKPLSLGYGFSMGGYAVLKHGAALGLTHGLAISPQVSIDPADVPGDPRFHRHFDPVLHGEMRVAPGDAPPVAFVAADPHFPQDAVHLDQAVRVAGAQPVPMRFLKHAVIARFTSTALFDQVARLVLAGDAAALRAHLRVARGGSRGAHLWLGRMAQARGHGRIAEALWLRAEALGAAPRDVAAVRALGLQERLFALLAAGRKDAARAVADQAIAAQPRQAHRLLAMARQLDRGGLPGKAQAAFMRALQVNPRELGAHLDLMRLLRRHGSLTKFAAARARAEAAMAGDDAALRRIAGAAQAAPAPIPPSIAVAHPDAPALTGDIERLIAAAASGDWALTLAEARVLQPEAATPRAVNAVVNAALMATGAEAAAFAASFVAGATLLDRHRVIHAWRLGQSGFLEAMLAILDAAPHLTDADAITDPFVRGHVVRLLQRAAASPRIAGERREYAQALAGRMLAPAAIEAHPTTVPFGPVGTPLDLSHAAVTLHLARRTPAHFAAEARQTIAAFIAATGRAQRPEVLLLENVVVDRRGLVWSRDGQPVMTYGEPVPPEGLTAMASAPMVPEAALAIERFNNIYHWFAEWVPSLAWRLNDATSTLPLLIGDRAATFMRETIALAACGPIPMIEAGDAVLVQRLYIGSRDPVRMVHRPFYGGLTERIGAQAEALVDPAIGTAPLYLSRRDSDKRRIGNEATLEAALAERGFDCVTFTGMPLSEQIARIRRAPMIVAPHGAGLGLMITRPPGARVLEILPAAPGTLALRTCFAKLSLLAGHHHEIWMEPANPFTQQWEVDIAGVLTAIDALALG